MTIREYRNKHRLTMSDEVIAAGEWLESQGYIFLKDFGTGNALNLASGVLTDRMEKDQWMWGCDEQY